MDMHLFCPMSGGVIGRSWESCEEGDASEPPLWEREGEREGESIEGEGWLIKIRRSVMVVSTCEDDLRHSLQPPC